MSWSAAPSRSMPSSSRLLAKALARRFGAQVELTVETDAALIGGIEIRAGDLVIDDSVRGKLKQLATPCNSELEQPPCN